MSGDNDWLFNEHIRKRMPLDNGKETMVVTVGKGKAKKDKRVPNPWREVERKADAHEEADRSKPPRFYHKGVDPWYQLMKRVRLRRASSSDIDALVYRVDGEEVKILLVMETTTFQTDTPKEEALKRYAKDISPDGMTRRMQGYLYRHMAKVHGCPALFIIHDDVRVLRPADTLYILRLDVEDSAWRKTTVKQFQARLRAL